MRTGYSLFFLFLFILLSNSVRSQVASDLSVQLTTHVQNSPPVISFSWPIDPSATGYSVFRKTKTATIWGSPLITLPGTAISFSDTSVLIGYDYEYRIAKVAPVIANTYVYSGIEVPATEDRGIILVITEDSVMTSLPNEVARLSADLEGDGWRVVHHTVNRNDAVTSVKALIASDYSQYASDLRSVFILGHVPVPYSGDLNPDGHPDHLGAWPADGYYGDMIGTWTDNSVDDTLASRPENKNHIGDGKFDQSDFPAILALQVGRVDFFNMPSFSLSQYDLLKQYLDRDHNYRQKKFSVPQRGLIDDNFGYFGGEGFASSGWRNFSAILGADSIDALDYFTTLDTSEYLWSYGCGGGTYTSCGGVGATANFATESPKSVFTMLFGSYFGDWDCQDNFLRAALASGGRTLASCWSGRPYWQFQHMGLGETIGYSAKVTQNNFGTYAGNYGLQFVSIALMGDPSLRMHTVAPPDSLVITPFATLQATDHIDLSWIASPDAILGYQVYLQDTITRKYVRINSTPVTGLSYTDHGSFITGNNHYLVRALKLENAASGTYYNLSEGITGSVDAINGIAEAKMDMEIRVFPNPATNQCVISSDKNPEHGTLFVTDVTGRTLFQKQISQFPETIDLSVFQSGVYEVGFTSKEHSAIKKLVVLR